MIFLIYILFSLNLFSQNQENISNYFLGNNFGLGYNLHSSDFKNLPNTPSCCPKFLSGDGIGFSNILFGKIPIFDKSHLILGFGYYDFSGEFNQEESRKIISPNKEYIDGITNHYLKANISAITFEPGISYNLYGINAYLTIPIGLNISKKFEQYEELISPTEFGTYYDETTGKPLGRRINNQSGEIQDFSTINFGLSLMFDYDFPLNKSNNLFLSPNIKFTKTLNEFFPNSSWNLSQISAGVGIKYSFKVSRKIYEKIENIDTIKVKKDFIDKNYVVIGETKITKDEEISGNNIIYKEIINRVDTLYIQGAKPIIDYGKNTPAKMNSKLVGEMDLIGIDKDMNPINFDKIKLNVELTREIYPLLPYVFFEENSADLPNRYVKISDYNQFNEYEIEPSPISYHRNNLNIIGKRLRENPKAKITINGYVDPETENGNCDLALERANTVKDYIVQVYDIDSDRIIIENDNINCYPKDLTKTKNTLGYQENRRVEIKTDNPELLFAVLNAKYEDPKIVEPSEILVKIKANNVLSAGDLDSYDLFYPKIKELKYTDVDRWDMKISHKNFVLLEETSNLEEVNIPFEINRYNALKLASDEAIEFQLILFDNRGMSKEITNKLYFEKDTSKIEVDKLTLTVFEVSSSKLNNKTKQEITKFISNLTKDSEIIITGYSDDLGNLKDNKELSQIRAIEVKNFIKSIAPNTNFGRVEGIGSEKYPPGVSSYLTPEERFISRTVEIEVRKSTK